MANKSDKREKLSISGQLFSLIRKQFAKQLAKEITSVNPMRFDGRSWEGPKTSKEYLIKYGDALGPGQAREVGELFSSTLTEKDYWSKWFHLLEAKQTSELTSQTAEDWSVMLLELLNMARNKWGTSRLPSGVLFEKDSNKVSLNAWLESGVDRINSGMSRGQSVYPDIHLGDGDRVMVIKDHVVFIEFYKSWQKLNKGTWLHFIPDLWFFRVIECLCWLDERPSKPDGEVVKAYIFTDPDWGLRELADYGYIKRTTNSL